MLEDPLIYTPQTIGIRFVIIRENNSRIFTHFSDLKYPQFMVVESCKNSDGLPASSLRDISKQTIHFA